VAKVDKLRIRLRQAYGVTDCADVAGQNCRGSRVGCFVIDAGGTPATTEK